MSLYLGDQIISGQATLVGESRNIGQIIPSTIPLTDAGLHLLDGSLIQGNGIYSAFVDYIAGLDLTANYFCTEQEWQTAVTTYGVCGKFVYDSVNNTVRLPKITGIIEGTTDLSALGDLVEAGLPNIAGYTRGGRGDTDIAKTPPFYSYNALQGMVTSSAISGTSLGFDASLSNTIYGNSSTVQPQTIKILYYIVIATSTKTDIQVDIDEVVTDLNGKADVDLSNCTKPHIVETYVNGTSWYRVYSDGWCEQGGRLASTGTGNYVSGSITFLKQFINTNYQCFIMSNGTGEAFTGKTNNKSNSSVEYNYVISRDGADWQASGYIS